MTKQRLVSLDALRGANLFFLVALGPILLSICHAVPDDCMPWLFDPIHEMVKHRKWEGFVAWDLIMPLFIFMSAISIPFSMARYHREQDYKAFAWRLTRRVLLLWLLGMWVQGNLRALDPHAIYLYSNTLQSIAVGYAVAALLFMFCRLRTWIITFVLLLLAYWGAMEWVSVDGYGGGLYGPTNNLCEWVDRVVLGRFRDQCTLNPDGSVTFAEKYTYTWILSSLTFAATGIAGLLAGFICKHERLTKLHKIGWLAGIGIGMTVLGWVWHLEMPVIKHIWTSSMVLVAGGYSFLLMALFFWWYDYRSHTAGLNFLQTYGLNSIAAYIIGENINFRSVSHTFFFGFEQYLGDYYNVLMVVCSALITYFILWAMKKNNIFVRL